MPSKKMQTKVVQVLRISVFVFVRHVEQNFLKHVKNTLLIIEIHEWESIKDVTIIHYIIIVRVID